MAAAPLRDDLWDEVERLLPPRRHSARVGGRRSTAAVPAQLDRHSARRNGVRVASHRGFGCQPRNLLAAAACLNRGGRLVHTAPSPTQSLGQVRRSRLRPGHGRILICPRCLGGTHTRPNRADCGKSGSKQNAISDDTDLPLLVHTTLANAGAEKRLEQAVVHRRSVQMGRRSRRKPRELYGDHGYAFPRAIAVILAILIKPRLAPCGTGYGSGMRKTRYVTPRTMALFGHWRERKVCCDKTCDHWQAYHACAAILISLRPWQQVIARA